MPHARLRALYADYDALDSAISLLNWDRQVLMPPAGGAARTAHVGVLTRMAHQIITGEELRRALEEAEAAAEPGSVEAAEAQALRREVEVRTKLPLELVERKARVSSDAYETWKRAKAEDDFPALAPYLEELFDIARETSALLGSGGHVYDSLIDLYEEGATCQDAADMFGAIKGPIVDLVREIRENGRPVDDSELRGDWDKERLRAFAESVTGAIGFDLDRGRLNVAPNAFCTNMSIGDVRMTTRASEHVKGIVSSSLHEMGHGLYEQGSPPEWDRTPLAGGISLAVHESQSRLWENIVGRSRGFWRRFLPDLKAAFPGRLSLDTNGFYRAINNVQPDFIRVGADELTYNLHILVRFELEVEILTRQIAIRDLPEAWNAKYTEYLGITPPTNTLGCLQDVHWSRGAVGYFPTYAMGNLIGGQMWQRLTADVPDVEERMAAGDFGPILGWLQERVYAHGKRYQPKELVRRVTGSEMRAEPWLLYARGKYGELYGLG
jgi:carboxypeptidase Taq